MSECKFDIGDRVEVIAGDSVDFVSVGARGTVIERSRCPWVRFDTRTGFGDYECSLNGWKEGYMDLIPEERMGLVHERPRSANDLIALGTQLIEVATKLFKLAADQTAEDQRRD